MRLSKAQKEANRDLAVISQSGHDYWQAVSFFQKRGITLARHPQDGYAFTGFLSGQNQTCAIWRKIVGSVDELIEALDAPSQIIKARDAEQPRVMARS